MLKSDFFNSLQEEWGVHIESGRGAAMFTVTFLQWMNKSLNMVMFATYMVPRPWNVMVETMRPHLDSKVLKIFQTKEAETFYSEFVNNINQNMKLQAGYAAQMLSGQGAPGVGAGIGTQPQAQTQIP